MIPTITRLNCATTIFKNLDGVRLLKQRKYPLATLYDREGADTYMGTILTQIWWGGINPEIVDPKTGLTARDVYRVKRTWALACKNKLATGTELFKRLFVKSPSTKEKFPVVKDLLETEYGKSSRFSAHVLTFVTMFNMVIDNLTEPDVAIALLDKLGDSHKKRKISGQMFEDTKAVLLELLVDILKIDGDHVESWDKTITFMNKHIIAKLE